MTDRQVSRQQNGSVSMAAFVVRVGESRTGFSHTTLLNEKLSFDADDHKKMTVIRLLPKIRFRVLCQVLS